MPRPSTFLVFGVTGGTGKHFTARALQEGHTVRAVVRDPSKLTIQDPNLHVEQGSITNALDLDSLVRGVDYVVSMLGDRTAQQSEQVNTAFVKRLVPAMRKHGVKRFLYQAGALSAPPGASLAPLLWVLRHTIARGFHGQHVDNEAVMAYLAEEARDVEWIVHRAGIGSDGPSKGTLMQSSTTYAIGTHRDCAEYNYRMLQDERAVHTMDFSYYA